MATVRSCDRCGKTGPSGGADIRKITVPKNDLAGSKEMNVDLCVEKCLKGLYEFLGEAMNRGNEVKPHRKQNGGD